MTLHVGEWRTTRDGERILIEGYNKHLKFPFWGWNFRSKGHRKQNWREGGVRVHWLPNGRVIEGLESSKDLIVTV